MRIFSCIVLMLACSFFCRSNSFADERAAFYRLGEYLVGGTWHGTEDGVPVQHTYRWAIGKQFLLRIEDESALAISGIDPVEGTFNNWVFKADGTVEVVASRELSNGPETSRVTLLGNAAKSEPDVTVDLTYEEDKLIVEEVAGTFDSTWIRKPLENDKFPSLASEAPKQMPKLMEHLIGAKQMEGDLSGDKFYGTSVGQWILDGRFFLCTFACIDEDQADWGLMYIFGKDPDTGKQTGWEFGGFPGAVTKWTLGEDGMTLTGKATMDGNTFTFSGIHKVLDDGTLKYTASGTMADDPTPIPYQWQLKKSE